MMMSKNITEENHRDESSRTSSSSDLKVDDSNGGTIRTALESCYEETNIEPIANASNHSHISPSSPLKNPWAKHDPRIQQQPTKVDFHSIMTQQEQEASKELATASGGTRLSKYDDEKVSEEELIQMAIKASLENVQHEEKAQYNISAANGEDNCHNSHVGDGDLDEDIKLAIQLSLAQANMEMNPYATNSMTFPLVDAKLRAHDYAKDANQDEVITTMETTLGESCLEKSPKDDNFLETDSSRNLNDPTTSVASMQCSTNANITREEEEEIMRAILEADDKEHAESIKLAMALQEEENRQYERIKVEKLKNSSSRSNVRTVTMGEFEEFRSCVAGGASASDANNVAGFNRRLYSHEDYDDHDEYYSREIVHQEYEDKYHHETDQSTVGYTINSSMPSKAWTKIDRNTIVGPNNEIRTKHDITLKNQSNADRLLGAKSRLAKSNGNLSVSDAAYNSFHQSLKNSMKRSMVKGVERSGTGRAENYAEKTRGGAMDGNVRLLITKAINNGLIQHCNGVVKEGKEAIVYHADAGSQSDGFDVAVKVFKRIEEFRNRSAYVDDDPRYHGSKFRNIDKRQQVEVWAEKEYRNLLRASRAGVAVPTPIMQKENVLFMRFLGEGGWPAPQLREIGIKKQSRKWIVLYIQVLVAIRRLYHCARLVHADLSEYNILVCPMSQVENAMDKSEEAKDDLQIVLIDFGQAVERNHPSALDLLERDLSLVNSFFDKQGIKTLPSDQCLDFVLEKLEHQDEEEQEEETYKVVNDSSKVDEVACPTNDDQESTESKEEWRHNIKGWDDVKDMEKLERMLAKIQSQHS